MMFQAPIIVTVTTGVFRIAMEDIQSTNAGVMLIASGLVGIAAASVATAIVSGFIKLSTWLLMGSYRLITGRSDRDRVPSISE